MEIMLIVLAIVGLSLFEIITSIDNAVINAEVLSGEVLDTTFSIDSVVGAFAFTFSVPFILIGNGIGALVLRWLTISNIDRIKKYKFLKNGAMYSIFFLGIIMTLHAFHINIPPYVSPIVTFGTVGYFFYKSRKELVSMREDFREVIGR